jgi:DNA repair protein RadC
VQTIGLPYGEDVRYQRAEPPLTIDTPAAARTFFSSCFGEQDPRSETLWVAHLDEQSRCLHLSRHEGDPSAVGLPLRAIILDAARHGTAAIILAHNHPSGDSRPSRSDLSATRRLASVAGALDCRVVDHLVFAGAECTSLKALGYL